jgi:hypothetical protein
MKEADAHAGTRRPTPGGDPVAMVLVFLVLIVLVAYYVLGAPLLDFIHRFVKDFTHSFPLLTFFLPGPKAFKRPK